MTNSPLPINGKRLAARWDIETIDLMYIIFNHDLNVFHPYEGTMSLEDIFVVFYKDRDLSDFVFRLAEVEKIETELGIDGKIPLSESIRGESLMERWDMNSDQIFMIVRDLKLEAIDPFGYEIGNKFLEPLITSNTLCVWELLFRLSDVENLESEHPEIIPKKIDDKKLKKKLRPVQIHKIKCREVAQKLWEEGATITIADMIHKDAINKVFDGKVYAEKTIRNWIKDLCPDRSPGRRRKKK
jgi:hypothetical protein